MIQAAVKAHPPPLVHGRRIKLRFAHLGGHNPPTIIIHGSQAAGSVPSGYRRYLEKTLRQKLNLTGTPLKIEFRQGSNPYEGRKNPLSKRQLQKRQRVIRHGRGK